MTATQDAIPGLADQWQHQFRHLFGHFCTGVSVITALDDNEPVGFACQALTAVSSDPPLVLFCPSRSLASWPRIARVGHFCVNVLSASQHHIARAFGAAGRDKFAAVNWTLSSGRAPVLNDVLAWAGCTVLSTHEAGDHYVVLSRVTELGTCRNGEPLLYYRGCLATAPIIPLSAPHHTRKAARNSSGPMPGESLSQRDRPPACEIGQSLTLP